VGTGDLEKLNASIVRVQLSTKKNVVNICLLCPLLDQAAVLGTDTNFKIKGEITDLIIHLI
jgi:hypothetical protein